MVNTALVVVAVLLVIGGVDGCDKGHDKKNERASLVLAIPRLLRSRSF